MPGKKNTKQDEGLERFRPVGEETDEIRAVRFLGLCKSCGECIVKCPVKCIDWDDQELGQLGEPAIRIDLDKCIGCETCEQICPDAAIQITKLDKKAEG